MALFKHQAWLTYATRSEHVPLALVLANSLRQVQTTRRIGVIASQQLSSDDQSVLRHSFDDLFVLDTKDSILQAEHHAKNGTNVEEYHAKIFAFSLTIFEKVTLLEPNSILLENCDHLFNQTHGRVVSLMSKPGLGGYSADFYLFSPCKPLYDFLKDLLGSERNDKKNLGLREVLQRYGKTWAENNRTSGYFISEENAQLGNAVEQLSLKTGELLERNSWTPPTIVQFIGGDLSASQQLEQIQVLLSQGRLGLMERSILSSSLKVLSDVDNGLSKMYANIAPETGNEPIAIVGMSCRLPGANGLEEFWKLLYAGEEGVREPPHFRWRKEHVVTRIGEKERKARAGFLNVPVDEFDAKFFGVSPREAELLDPQSRLMHEVVWESLENAGVDPSSLRGSHMGVFTGSWMNDYKDILYCNAEERDLFRYYMGNGIGAGAARLSFLLGLTGPCIATESGCSSAMVAVDMAVKSLRAGETNLALAGGVNLLLHPFTNKFMDFIIAPDGRCKTFDAKADGFVRAEGCGVLVLKRLSDALKDRDHIWALIRGSAVSQDGISRSFGTPTVHCEALALQLALKNAGVKPEEISFVETHGTGTSVGDPMEVAAIAKAYHVENRKDPLVIGSVKTNVGHTESVSGITGIIKTVLAMQHELIPKHLNLETVNPEINLELVPATIPLEPIAWPKVPGRPRFAGVSSFGITGTDGHVIIEEAPNSELPKLTMGLERPLHILKISAKSPDALEELLQAHQNTFAAAEDKGNFANVAYTGNVGRAEFNQRAFILADDFNKAAETLKDAKVFRGERMESKRTLCFLFTGQGSQYSGMAKSLYESSPVFQFHFDRCDNLLRKEYSVDIKKVLWETKENSEEISRTIYSQIGIFVVEYCLLQLWRSWGLKPDVVLGHSLGEFCAAVAAGILTFEDALKLVANRSRLIDNLPRGSMLVLKASQTEVEKMMMESNIFLDIAALNSPEQTVVAGDTEKVEKLLAFCIEQGMKGIILDSTHAFHSKHMEPMLEEYRKIAEGIKYKEPTECQYISGMEGTLKETLDANYWVRHTREKVNFLEACKVLKENEVGFCLEVGPKPVLSTFVMQNVDQQVSCLPSLRKGTNDWETMLTSLGKLWVAGHKVEWEKFDKPYERRKVNLLPSYPFQRKSFWVDVNELPPVGIHPLVGARLNNASNLSIYQNDLRLASLPYLKDHCIGNRILFPGSAFTEMCLAAGYVVSNFLKDELEKPRQPVALENLRIEAPLELKDGKPTRLQAVVDLPEKEMDKDSGASQNKQSFRCRIFHRKVTETEMGSSEKWVAHATADFSPLVGDAHEILQQQWDGDRIKEMTSKAEYNSKDSLDTFYKRTDSVGLKFGETFRSVLRDWREIQEELQLDELVAEVKVPVDVDKYLLHPLLIDAMFQAQVFAGVKTSSNKLLRVPVNVGRLVVFRSLPEMEPGKQVAYVHVRWTEKDKCRIFLSTHDFHPVAVMEQVELLETNVKTIESVLESQNSEIPDCWEEQWNPLPGISDKRADLTTKLEAATHSPQFLKDILASAKVTKEHYVQTEMVNRLVTLYAYRALQQMGWRPKPGDELSAEEFCSNFGVKADYLQQLVYFYFGCFRDELKMTELLPDGKHWKIVCVPDEEVLKEIHVLHGKLLKCENMVVAVQIYENVSKNLVKVLTGEENPLAILFPLDSDKQHLSAEQYYLQHPGRIDIYSKSITILRHTTVGVKELPGNKDGKKVLRVLEVGAGTGSLSKSVLQELMNSWGSKFEYYFTDISASFFAKAEKRLEEYKDKLNYAVFNIEEHPLPQGIPLNYFDMVFATDVLHATRNLAECVRNLRLTMKPGGYLLFTETICADKGITSIFGLLEGYWRFQDFERRPHHPAVDLQAWKRILQENGFGYVYCLDGYTGELGIIMGQATHDQWGKMVQEGGRTAEDAKVEVKMSWVVFMPERMTDQQTFLKVSETLRATGGEVKEVYLESGMEEKQTECLISRVLKAGEGEEIVGVIYACGVGAGGKNPTNVAMPLMHICKHLINASKPPRLCVVTKNLHVINDVENVPGQATLVGMAKSLKNENGSLIVRCVDLDSEGDWRLDVDQVLYELAMCKNNKEKERMQVCYRAGQRWEPRLNRVPILPRAKSDLKLPPSANRYQLVLPETKVINDLEFTTLEEYSLKPGEVEVRCLAYALNFRDLFAILRPIKEFENTIAGVGLDFSGVVTRVGPEEQTCKVGDRVFGVNFKEAPLPSHIVVKTDEVLKMPERSTFAEACTLPAVFSTSIHCLINVAQLKKGDTVLIHTGSGGVGLSAIQVARHVGAEIITTAGNPRKRAYLRSLGIQHVFHSRDTSYEEDILRVTKGRGVDVVLNSITGPGFKEATLAVCAKNARFVEMSKLSVWTPEEVKERRPDVQYWSIDLTTLDPTGWRDLQDKANGFLRDTNVSFIPYVKFDALRIRQALQFLQKAKHIGKVVVTMPEAKVEQGQWKVKVNLFDSDSTYLITGGLGGIGLEVCKWMLEKGATDIVLNGRNPPKPEVQKEIDRLNRKPEVNVKVLLADIGDIQQCTRLIREITETSLYKPLRGIHHCAGVVKDNLYAYQTWDSFKETFNPKVSGTWNLHELTRGSPLEHFVMYSSMTALFGTPGQGNHCAATSFEDAFAHYRHSLGLPATSINWGQWAQVGCAKEVSVNGLLPVSVERMLNGLEETMRGQRLQMGYSDFENLGTFFVVIPTLKHYFDEKLLKSLNSSGKTTKHVTLQTTTFWKEVDEAEEVSGKMEVVTRYMKTILRSELRMDPDEPIKDDANMQDLGVDSLMLLELRNSIQSLLGSRINVSMGTFKDCQTIRDLATVIVNQIMGQGNDEKISVVPLSAEEFEKLLREDCVLEEEIRPIEGKTNVEADKISTILVTGVTGQVGPYMLAALSKMEKVTKIICLIRARESLKPEEKLGRILKGMRLGEEVDMDKLECVRGDVTKEHFGLEEAQWEKLSREVDCVIHLAAKSNHVEAYRKVEGGNGGDIRTVNVGGTRNALRFAVTGRTKSVFYTGAILASFGEGDVPDALSDKWPDIESVKTIAEMGISGYPVSKFVSEMLLKQALDRGIPCKVFKLPWVMGESTTGQLNFQSNHLILRFMTYLKLKAIPSAPVPAMLLPVDTCVDWSLKLFWNDQAPCGIYNVMHPNPQLEVEFVQMAQKEFGVELELVDWTSKEFVEKMYATEMPLEALKELYQDSDKLIEIGISDTSPAVKGFVNFPGTFFRNPKVAKYIPDFAEGLPSTMDILEKNLLFVKNAGYFSKFGI